MFTFLLLTWDKAEVYGKTDGNYDSEKSALRGMRNWSAPENDYKFALAEYSKFSDGSLGGYRIIRKYIHNVDGSFTTL